MAMTVETYLSLGLEKLAPTQANGRSIADFAVSLNHEGDRCYNPCAEALAGGDVPAGAVTGYRDWARSAVYADTTRDIWVYTPPGFDGATANLIVFNDGAGYLNREGPVRAARVLDALLAKGEIAPIVAVFVNPGRLPIADDASDREKREAASAQRSLEYDSVTPDFGRFLLDEVLPFVEASHDLKFTVDPAGRTICGISSGGICAFTAAWFFPERFGRVLSHCGSFTNIHGGHNYPYLIRSTPRKPVRVFLQSGANDASYITGDWPLANQTMASALAFAGYDHRFEFGTGGHSLRHGGAILADSLRWLWRTET